MRQICFLLSTFNVASFQVKTINRILYELELDKQLNLIDIGTNVGQHCLAAALIGRDSIAIDAAEANIEHVCVYGSRV
jgi:2-polyprenyl-3-methyl-5-hydroxy-6-metoxy-1,4-benzoquinol methylase